MVSKPTTRSRIFVWLLVISGVIVLGYVLWGGRDFPSGHRGLLSREGQAAETQRKPDLVEGPPPMARKVAASPEQESSDESDGQKKVEGKPWTFPREWESGIPNHKMLLGSTMNPVDTEQIERRLENTPDISAIKADFTPDEVQRILDHAKSEIEYYLPLRKEYSTLQHEWINTLRFEEGIVFRTREERRAYLESHYRGLNGTWTRIWTTKTRKDPTGRREWSLHVADPVQEVSLYRGQARLLEASDLLYQKMYQYIITRW